MDINVQPMPALTFITIGGIIDFFLFLGPSPAEVVTQYTDIIGTSQFPQYFTLGFHLCRWGYNSTDGLRKIIQRKLDKIKIEIIYLFVLANKFKLI